MLRTGLRRSRHKRTGAPRQCACGLSAASHAWPASDWPAVESPEAHCPPRQCASGDSAASHAVGDLGDAGPFRWDISQTAPSHCDPRAARSPHETCPSEVPKSATSRSARHRLPPRNVARKRSPGLEPTTFGLQALGVDHSATVLDAELEISDVHIDAHVPHVARPPSVPEARLNLPKANPTPRTPGRSTGTRQAPTSEASHCPARLCEGWPWSATARIAVESHCGPALGVPRVAPGRGETPRTPVASHGWPAMRRPSLPWHAKNQRQADSDAGRAAPAMRRALEATRRRICPI